MKHFFLNHRWHFVYAGIMLSLIGLFIYAASKIHTYTIPAGSIVLDIPYSKYVVGEDVTFSLKNNFNTPIYVVNNCPAEPLAVYKKIDGKWILQHDTTSEKSCSSKDRQIKINSGGVQSGSFAAWKNLFSSPGEYRIVTHVEYFDVTPYQDIEIIARPTVSAQTQQPTAQIPSTPSASTPQPDRSAPSSTPSAPSPSPAAQATPAPVQPSTPSTRSIATSAGSINVSYTSSSLTILSVSPASGCRYEKNGTTGTNLEVTFKCGGQETQVKLLMRNGQLVQRIE